MSVKAEQKAARQDRCTMTDGEFAALSGIILSECGISLTPVKKVMLTVRLIKRIKALGMQSFREYVKFIESPEGRSGELHHMIDSVSTNKTEFFREADHFDYLTRVSAPALEREYSRCRLNGIRVWSAGCSSGEEPYTIAMVLSEYREAKPGFRFTVLASDISNHILDEAVRAVYTGQEVDRVPAYLRKKYLMKGKGRMSGHYRVVPELRRLVSFKRMNLSDREFELKGQLDVIFCRNVIIYLGRKVQENLFYNFHKCLSPGGYLFVGHSETLDGISSKFKRVAPTIYRRS